MHIRFGFVLAVLLPLSSVACSVSSADNTGGTQEAADTSGPTSASLANFRQVGPGLYRGGHPDAAGLDYLKLVGVKRIVNLEVGDFIEAFPWDISTELSDASDRGITEIRYPMSAFEPAVSDDFDHNIDAIMKLLKTATPEDGIYVHCKHGQDRTGLVMGLERVIDESWQPQDAFNEMVKIGFHTGFLGLDEYFEQKTNWHR